MSEFNPAWIERSFSVEGQKAAMEYLDIWNSWTKTSIQGQPLAPIGVVAGDFPQKSRYQMFINDSGLVPTHMPWIVSSALKWMERDPCSGNTIPVVDRDAFDQYGRYLKQNVVLRHC
eukprot:2542728-Amphidinium_carterae.1